MADAGVTGSVEQRAEAFRTAYCGVRDQVSKVIVGQRDVIDGVLTCAFSGGHALLEGVPGLGKTLLVRTLAQCMDLRFSRIQFTPDLMPADITGTNILAEHAGGGREFRFQAGPVFASIVLADEINRATPKTQSAMLEAMQEHSVTVAGKRHVLDEPFLVLATQNPIEMEGTYPLPEAQMDRFQFKVLVAPPDLADLAAIVDRTTGAETPAVEPVIDGPAILSMRELAREVPMASHVRDYALHITLGTQPGRPESCEAVRKYVRYGSSPRGAQAIVLASKVRALAAGRFNVAYEDIEAVAVPALRHRVLLNFEGEAEGISTDALVASVIAQASAALPGRKEA